MSLFRRLSLAAAAFLSLSSLSRASVPALATALNTPSLAWTTGGDAEWAAQTAVTQDGVDAAQATGLINIDDSAWIETTVAAPGFLSWNWRLDVSADNGSVLELLVGDDSIPRASLYSSDDWAPSTLVVDGSGLVTLRWRLRRLTDSASPSPDAAYLDTVAYAAFGPPVLQTHTDLSARGFTAHWTALDQATSYVVEVSTSADFSVSSSTSAVDAPATSCAVGDLEPGTTYYYRLVASGPESITARSASRSLATPAVVHPANDAFASASTLANASGSVAATTVEATTQAGEPFSHQASVWFKWTAPTAGLWRFQTAASAASAPVLHAYTGTSLADLDLIDETATTDDSGAALVEFEAVTGVTYFLALDAASGAQSATTLSWERLALYTPPANDAFAAPTALSGASGSVDATNLRATAEAGETASALHSVWFSWKATASGVWTLDTTGGAIPVVLSVWSGSALNTLTLLASDSAASPAASRVSLPVVKDTVYRVSLDGQQGAQGALHLAWSLAVPSVAQTITPPTLADLPVDAPPFLLEAFASSGLPVTYAIVSGPATLVDGDSLTLTGQPGTVTIRSFQAGDGTYLPAQFDFTLIVRSPPANDSAANALLLSGNSGAIDADLRFATAAPDENYPAQRSVWFRWTAPATGILTLDTAESAIPATLAVFTGAVGDLQSVASDTRSDVRPRLAIPVSSGVVYLIALDTLAETPGTARLSWSFAARSLAQTIDFPALPDLGRSAAPFLLEATASSGLPVTFSLVSGPATLDGALLTLTGQAGKVTVRASQLGDFSYLPAPDVLVSFTVRPPPANDQAAAAILLSGASGSATGSDIDASPELFDPFPANRSVWWRWTAPATGLWTVDTAGSAQPVTLSILRGATPAALEILASDARSDTQGRLTVPVEKAGSYWIVLDSLDDLQGALNLTWSLAPASLAQTIDFPAPPDLGRSAAPFLLEATASSGLPVTFSLVSGPATLDGARLTLTGQAGKITVRAAQPGDFSYLPAPDVLVSFTVRPPPANDQASAAILLSGASGSATGSNIDASSELFDPLPASHSVWWRWTAPATGLWTIDTAGSAQPVTLSVLRGATPAALELLASDARFEAQGRLIVPVYKGSTYWIVLDAFDDLQGALKLAWTLAAPSLEQTIVFDQPADLILGDTPPALSPSASSGLPVSVTVVSGPARIADGVLSLTGKAGKVTLRATQLGDAVYKPALPVTRTFTVAALPPLTITFSDLHQSYDGNPHGVGSTVSPNPRLRDLVVTYNGSLELPKNAGTYTVVATADASRATARLVIEKARLVVTAANQYKFAGEPNPALTFSYSGFVPGDDETTLVRAPVASTGAGVSSPGGSYAIKVAGGSSPNYLFTYVPGILTVDTFAGRYEALLFDSGALPAGKIDLTVAASGKAFTGKLTLARETVVLPFTGTLSLDSSIGLAGASVPISGGSGAYVLNFDLVLDGRLTATLDLNGTWFATAPGGQRIVVPKTKPSWSGAHTVILGPGSASSADAPAGSGHATAAIDAKGNLILAGRLADDTLLTATLPPDATGAYRLFALPYAKRRESYLSGEFILLDHPDTARFPGRRYLPASAGVTLTWAKAASSADKTYRTGFGPLLTTLNLDPWLRLTAPTSLALAFSPADLDLGESTAALPLGGVLSPAGTFTVAGSANPTRFTLKFTPGTGAFTGSFFLSDQVSPAPAKPEPRTVTFSGVLRTPPETEPAAGTLLGTGHFLLAPLSTSGNTTPLSGELRLEKP